MSVLRIVVLKLRLGKRFRQAPLAPPGSAMLEARTFTAEPAQTEPPPTAPPPPSTTLPPAPPPSDPSSTPVPTASPTPGLDFSGAIILNVGYLPGGSLMITIQAPFALPGDYRALVGQDAFECRVLPAYPERLYCVGAVQPAGKQIIQVFPLQGERMLFALEFIIPGTNTTVPEPAPGFERKPPQDRNPEKEPTSEPDPYPYPGPP